MNTVGFRKVLVLAVLLLLPALVSAQFLMEDVPSEDIKLGLQMMRPDLKGGSELSLLSWIYDVSLSVPLGKRFNVTASAPVVVMDGDQAQAEVGLGNIFLALRYRLVTPEPDAGGNKKTVYASFGGYIPTLKSDAGFVSLMGLLANPYGLEKYYIDTTMFYGNLGVRYEMRNGLRLGLEIGPRLHVSENGFWGERDTAWLVHYGASIGYRYKPVLFNAELVGMYHVNAEGYSFSERTFHRLALGAQWNRGSFRPGVFYSLQLDNEFGDRLRGAIGIKCDFILNK
ncbi:MAG: hypothetical protein GY765_21740 [bacterium]|nr:hypothetical protein [bacterium]